MSRSGHGTQQPNSGLSQKIRDGWQPYITVRDMVGLGLVLAHGQPCNTLQCKSAHGRCAHIIVLTENTENRNPSRMFGQFLVTFELVYG